MRTLQGFSLVELMVTVAIIAVLGGIAYPSYRNYTLRARRTEATTSLMQAAATLQRCYSQYYAPANGGFSYIASACKVQDGTSYDTQNGYYTISASVQAAAFTLTAQPKPIQAADTSCAKFTYDQNGTQKVQNSAGTDTTTTCWPAR